MREEMTASSIFRCGDERFRTSLTGGTAMIIISRPINGISINGDEYLLGDDGEPMRFETTKDLVMFLFENNFTIAEIEGLNFETEGVTL
jgi:hypothetical protein